MSPLVKQHGLATPHVFINRDFNLQHPQVTGGRGAREPSDLQAPVTVTSTRARKSRASLEVGLPPGQPRPTLRGGAEAGRRGPFQQRQRGVSRALLKGSEDLGGGLSSTRLRLADGNTLLQRQKGGASNWRQSEIPEQSPPSSIICSEILLKKQ